MKRILSLTVKGIGIILLLFSLIFSISFVNHRIQLKREEEHIKVLGELVTVNDYRMHIYSEGAGEETLVFMSGGGTSSPVLDFKALYSELSSHYKIVVVEKLGYGNSDVADMPRDITSILSDTREALKLAGHSGPYVLLPHSMSGLEALYWAQNYPKEVTQIIGLDMAVPKAYRSLEINKPLIFLTKFAADTGMTRFIPGLAESDAIKFGNLTDEQKEMYRAIFYRRTATQTMLNEFDAVKENAETVEEGGIPEIPILIFASNGEGTGFESDVWQDTLYEFTQITSNGQFLSIDAPHYLHNHEYELLANEIQHFLAEQKY